MSAGRQEIWKPTGNSTGEEWKRGKTLEEALAKAELGEGKLDEDGTFALSIEGGALLDQDHCIVLVLGPGEHDKAVDVLG